MSGRRKGGSLWTFARNRAPGSEHHLIVDRHGTPSAVSLTSGDRHDVTQVMPLLDATPHLTKPYWDFHNGP